MLRLWCLKRTTHSGCERCGGPTSGYATVLGVTPTGLPVSSSGAYASAQGNGGYSSAEAVFSTATLIGAGTSGLANGTPVTLRLNLQLDGNTSVTSGVDAGYANMSYGYTVRNPDQAVYEPGDGWSVPTIASFGADVRHDIDNFYSYYYDPAGGYYQDFYYRSRWSWNSNVASDSGLTVEDYSLSPISAVPHGSSSDSRSFATGLVEIDFMAYVGDTINIDSYLDVWADTYGSGSLAMLDFLNTLQAGISSPYVSGIELIRGGIGATVPVPAAVWLLGPALIGLLRVGRGRVTSSGLPGARVHIETSGKHLGSRSIERSCRHASMMSWRSR